MASGPAADPVAGSSAIPTVGLKNCGPVAGRDHQVSGAGGHHLSGRVQVLLGKGPGTHLRLVQDVGVGHQRQRVPGQRLAGEDVGEGQRHPDRHTTIRPEPPAATVDDLFLPLVTGTSRR